MGLWACLPLVLQNGIQQRIPPAALHPFVLTQVSFPAHPDFLQDMRGADILRDAPRPDAVQSQLRKAEGQEGACRLGRITPAPIAAIQLIPDVSLVRVRTFHADTAVADERPIRRE